MWKIIIEFDGGFSAKENSANGFSTCGKYYGIPHNGFLLKENSTNGFSTCGKLLSNSTGDFLQRKIPQMDFPHVESIMGFHNDFLHKENSTNGFFACGKLLSNSINRFTVTCLIYSIFA